MVCIDTIGPNLSGIKPVLGAVPYNRWRKYCGSVLPEAIPVAPRSDWERKTGTSGV